MIRTWIADVSPLMEGKTYEKYYRQVPEERQKKADKIRYHQDKALSVGVWVLYQKALEESGLSGENVFNLSHSGHFVFCSVADSKSVRTGCDLEMTGTLRMNVAERFFCRSEWEYIKNKPTKEERTEVFFRYWVLKESFMKATRLGMKLPLNAFEIKIGNGVCPELLKKPEEFSEEFYLREYEDKLHGFHAAVCSEDPDIEEKLHWVTL